MLPRLEAEESIAAVNRLLVGTRNASPASATSTARGWERAASGETAPSAVFTGKVTAQHLQAIKNLGVRPVPARG